MHVFKLLRAAEWARFAADGSFVGSPDDLRDGFIHLSTAGQVAATAAKYFANGAGVMLVTVATAALGDDLRWEASRGGAAFPHLYRALHRTDIVDAGPWLSAGRRGQAPNRARASPSRR